MTKLLIDADFTVYKCCASCEDDLDFGEDVIVVVSKFSEALAAVKRDLNRIRNEFMWDTPELVLFFSDSKNFRKDIYPDYKGHRNRKKPAGYKRVINALAEEFTLIKMPGLEADDALGIYATQNPGNIICSPDKDMRQIPGLLYDMDTTIAIDKEEGRRWHLIQSLAGDQTDGYSGCPGFGVKRAVAWFEEEGYNWEAVVKAFKSKDLDEEEALKNARLARILTVDDYDFDKQQPIYWTPSTSNGSDDGAGLQAEAA